MFKLICCQLAYEPFHTFLTGGAIASTLTVIVLWLEHGALRDRKSEQHSWVIDPVCGMRVDEWIALIMTEYRDKKFVFCLSRCLSRFEDASTC